MEFPPEVREPLPTAPPYLPSVPDPPLQRKKSKFVCNKIEPLQTPAQMTCKFCQEQVTSEVTYQVGVFAWVMCILFALCGLVFGCCLIPFFVKSFKDVRHTCPRCQHVLHIHKRMGRK